MTRADVQGATPEFSHGPDRPLPSRSEVAVVGGGVVGVTAALTLAERGIPVVLLEKGRIAGEQSSRNWGWIRNQGRDIREIPLMLEAQNMWRQYGTKIGQEIGLREKGVAYLALNEAELAGHEAWLESTRPFQLSTRLLTPAEAGELAGQDAASFKGGILTPTDMHAEPALAVPALARLAARAGAQIFEGTAVPDARLCGRAVDRHRHRTWDHRLRHRDPCRRRLVADFPGEHGPIPAPACGPKPGVPHGSGHNHNPRPSRHHPSRDPATKGRRSLCRAQPFSALRCRAGCLHPFPRLPAPFSCPLAQHQASRWARVLRRTRPP